MLLFSPQNGSISMMTIFEGLSEYLPNEGTQQREAESEGRSLPSKVLSVRQAGTGEMAPGCAHSPPPLPRRTDRRRRRRQAAAGLSHQWLRGPFSITNVSK